jgi:phage terminase large subunit-like protein
VAERSAEYASQIAAGTVKDPGLLYDHQEAPGDTDMTDRESLLAGLAVAYGDSAEPAGGWVDLDRIIAEIWDPATDPQDARAFYLGQITHASDSWVSSPEWSANADPLVIPVAGDAITLGFDGSRHRSYGITDATALIAVRLEDAHMFPIGIWEQPDNVKNWWPDVAEIHAAVAETFDRYHVVGFYADPAADWRSYVASWEARYGAQLAVSSTRDHPIEWWMGGQNAIKTVRATTALHSAIVHRAMSHDGSSRLRSHFLNARRREHRSGIMIAKDFPDSPRKIDAAVAGILAFQAYLDAKAAGVSTAPPSRSKRLVRF